MVYIFICICILYMYYILYLYSQGTLSLKHRRLRTLAVTQSSCCQGHWRLREAPLQRFQQSKVASRFDAKSILNFQIAGGALGEHWLKIISLSVILLMEEILHKLIGSLSHYLQGFIHPRWLFGISSSNSNVQKKTFRNFQDTSFPSHFYLPGLGAMASFE